MNQPPPRRCLRCKRNTAVPGEFICWPCSIGIAQRACRHEGTPELVVSRTANGYRHPKIRCRTCYRLLGSPKLRDIDENEVEAEVREVRERPSCARCGRTDAVEVHHWAPYHLFPDSDDWPTSPLCPDCHRAWHRVTRTDGSSSLD